MEIGNELFYYIFEGEPSPINGLIDLDDNTDGLGIQLTNNFIENFNIIK